jgi:hypothetical protein
LLHFFSILLRHQACLRMMAQQSSAVDEHQNPPPPLSYNHVKSLLAVGWEEAGKAEGEDRSAIKVGG